MYHWRILYIFFKCKNIFLKYLKKIENLPKDSLRTLIMILNALTTGSPESYYLSTNAQQVNGRSPDAISIKYKYNTFYFTVSKYWWMAGAETYFVLTWVGWLHLNLQFQVTYMTWESLSCTRNKSTFTGQLFDMVIIVLYQK